MNKQTKSEGKKCKECNAPLCGCDANDAGIIHYGCKHFTDAHKPHTITEEILKEFRDEFFTAYSQLWKSNDNGIGSILANGLDVERFLVEALSRQREEIVKSFCDEVIGENEDTQPVKVMGFVSEAIEPAIRNGFRAKQRQKLDELLK